MISMILIMAVSVTLEDEQMRPTISDEQVVSDGQIVQWENGTDSSFGRKSRQSLFVDLIVVTDGQIDEQNQTI